MVELLISSAAELDYAEALNWYADRDVHAAEGFDAEFDRAIQSIVEDPGRFPQCDERHHFYLMRRFPYQLIFRKATDHWVIIAVATRLESHASGQAVDLRPFAQHSMAAEVWHPCQTRLPTSSNAGSAIRIVWSAYAFLSHRGAASATQPVVRQT